MIVSCIPEFSSPKCKKPAIPHNSTFLRTEWRHKLSIFCAECIAVKLQIAQNVAWLLLAVSSLWQQKLFHEILAVPGCYQDINGI